MGDIRICSFNCRGLGTFEKRRDVLNYLHQSEFNIFMLQDIHCAPEYCCVVIVIVGDAPELYLLIFSCPPLGLDRLL